MKSVFSPADCFYKVVNGVLCKASSGFRKPERRHTLSYTFRLILNCDLKLRDSPPIEPLNSHIHESLGHFGGKKYHELPEHYFYWTGMEKDMLNLWVLCMKCQANKSLNHIPIELLRFLLISYDILDHIAMDRLGSMVKYTVIGQTFHMILVVINTHLHGSNVSHQFEYHSWRTGFHCIRTYLICSVWSGPFSLTTDRDKLFDSHFG